MTGFVDYNGFVEFVPETDAENKSYHVLKSRKITVEYSGNTVSNYELTNETKTYDDSIYFGDVDYKFNNVNITITYHHEGLSGDKNLSYKTILLTKYNYTAYLNIDIKNESNYKITYDENDRYHHNPIYNYNYYQTYTIRPSGSIKGNREFNNVVLSFSNNVVIKLDALGFATFKSSEHSQELPIPKLSEVDGCIDYYPPANYEYGLLI